MIRFRDTVYLLLIIFPVLLVLWRRFAKRHGERHIAYSSRDLIGEMGETLRVRLVRFLPAVKSVGLLLFILALARPQLLRYTEVEKKKATSMAAFSGESEP